MKYAITSDVHLGDGHCRVEAFKEFVRRLRPEVTLVLGGDVVDDPLLSLDTEHLEALEALRNRYHDGAVIWIRGNHDEGAATEGGVTEQEEFTIPGRLHVCHGDRFDNVMPYNRWFIRMFGWLHRLRITLGAHPVHVAQFAKKFKILYSFLRRNVMMNAVEHAMECGFTHAACGHVHYAETCEKDGITYYNLGAWTEDSNHCLLVDEDTIELVPVDEAMTRSEWFDG